MNINDNTEDDIITETKHEEPQIELVEKENSVKDLTIKKNLRRQEVKVSMYIQETSKRQR